MAGRTNRNSGSIEQKIWICKQEKIWVPGFNLGFWTRLWAQNDPGTIFLATPFSIYILICQLKHFWHPSLQVNCYSQKMIIIKINTQMLNVYLASKTREINIIQNHGMISFWRPSWPAFPVPKARWLWQFPISPRLEDIEVRILPHYFNFQVSKMFEVGRSRLTNSAIFQIKHTWSWLLAGRILVCLPY